MIERQIERLAASGIRLLIGSEGHCVFERDGFAALVPRGLDRLLQPGAAGLLTERGLAQLIWRGDSAWFILKDREQPASAAEVDALRRFASDLEAALEG